MTKNQTIYLVIFYTLLIMFSANFSYAQKDTLYTIDSSIENIIKASAKDSMVHDENAKQLHLYGDAVIYYEQITLKADYLLVDFNKNEVYASYTINKEGKRVGAPEFTDGADKINAAKIRYNFKTKKGFIQEVKLKQEENYLYMEVAKRHANEHVHFRKGRFTTCDLDEPHYHFQLSKAILVPKKRIVSGPMNLWIAGVPTPLGLPFIFIPQKKIEEKRHGILFPQFSLQSPYGMGFQNLGYYIPINDSIHTTIYADLYTRGTFGLRTQTSYKIKYKFQGDFNVGFQRFKSGFLDTLPPKKLAISWVHRQDPKANPLWNFSSNVNFMSDNNPKANLDPLNQNYFQNSLNSDINITRNFPGKPIYTGMKISARQNSFSSNFAVTSPVFNFNVTRFSPFSKIRKEQIGEKKWYESIVMSYNFEGQNRSSFHDSLVKNKRYDLIGQSFVNGITQNATLQTTLSLFKNTWKLNPSVFYTNKINFQQIRKNYNSVSNTTDIDTLRKIGSTQNVSFNAQLTTALYSYYRFVGKNKAIMRHILTPSFGLSYVPAINKVIKDSVGVNKALLTYSPFERSLYSDNVSQTSAFITFGFNNTFEMKRKSDKDTLTGFKKTKLIEAFSFSGSYDIMRDSMRLSRISSSLRLSPLPFVNLVASANFSPYNWNDSTNQELSAYALTERGKLVRFIGASINTSFVLTSKESRNKIVDNAAKIQENWNADFQYFALHPNEWVDFAIPWKASFTHVFDLSRSSNPLVDKKFNQTQTLGFNGDVSLTKRWKVICDSYFDIYTKKVINTRLSITRNMHCWNLAFYWTPIGGNQSFLLRINSTSNLFRDAKLELRKPPELF